jgi:hypothetical protein
MDTLTDMHDSVGFDANNTIGTTEVLYMVDVKLRKELTVDGASIEKLPTAPSLMIMESGHDTTSSTERAGKKEKKEEGSLLSSLLSGEL